MQILAFDFGTQYIGVAVGQTVTNTSSPLVVLKVDREEKKYGIQFLISLKSGNLIKY